MAQNRAMTEATPRTITSVFNKRASKNPESGPNGPKSNIFKTYQYAVKSDRNRLMSGGMVDRGDSCSPLGARVRGNSKKRLRNFKKKVRQISKFCDFLTFLMFFIEAGEEGGQL